MSDPLSSGPLSRRAALGAMVLGAAGAAALPGPEPSSAAPPPAAPAPSSTVRDRLWIFTVYPGSNDSYLELGGVRGGSRMTPAEGAFWLGVPNLLFIREHEVPRLPNLESWRAKTSFEQYATSMQPLKRVAWSVVGSGGKGGMNELPYVLPLAKKFPNITGIYLDDFIIDRTRRADGRLVGRPALTPDELKAARQKLQAVGRPMDVWVTLYSHELLPAHPRAVGCDPPLPSFLGLFDVLTLWTWNSDELPALDESLAALEAMAPQGARIALGMYLWDFHNRKPVSVEHMKHQCSRGLEWLRKKRVHDLIFLANTVLDVGLESAEYARRWISEVGDQPL